MSGRVERQAKSVQEEQASSGTKKLMSHLWRLRRKMRQVDGE
jgi:hypothetical protein